MAYALNGLIEATDYNTFCCTAGGVLDAWGVGAGSLGYGQANFTNVAVADLVRERAATQTQPGGVGTTPTWGSPPEWRALVDTINAMSRHQTGGAAPLTGGSFPTSGSLPTAAPAAPGDIAYGTTLAATIASVISTQRLNAGAQSVGPSITASSPGTWTQTQIMQITATWGSADQARYFWNAGGQLKMTFAHTAAGNPGDAIISNLCGGAGTMVMSSTGGAPASVTIGGSSFNGITRVGGSAGSTNTLNANSGFYGLGASTTIYQQTSGTNYIRVDAALAGNTITFDITFLVTPVGTKVSAGTSATLQVFYPSTAYLKDTWGTVTLGSSVTPQCPEPVVGTITPNTYTPPTLGPPPGFVPVLTPYNGTITITNCTSATITNTPLPAGLTIDAGAPSGADFVFTVSGSPTVGSITTTFTVTSATNACAGSSPQTVLNKPAGALNDAAPAACATPTIGAALTPASATVGTPYTASITINNATTGSITNLPTWLTQSGAASGANWVITVTGTPAVADVTAGLALLVNGYNGPGGCAPVNATGLAGGTLVVGNLPACTAPTISAVLTPAAATVGVAYTATINVANATAGVTVTNKPAWLSESVTYTAPNATITLTGTPAGADVTAGLALTVNATNSPAGCTATNATGLAGGTLVVGVGAVCTAPTIGAALSPTNASVGVAFTATITVNNATTASVTNLPAWLSSSGAASGANWVLTLTGTPAAGDITAGLSLLVDATNTGVCTTNTVTGLAGGTLVVIGACTTPVIGASLSPATATVGSAYTATITVNNATTASVTNLPAWLSSSGAASGANWVLTLTGTPAAGDVTAGLALLVDATNAAAGCVSSSATGLAGGTLVVGNLPACTTPTIGAALSPTNASVGVAFTATITVNNATTASVTNLPAWLSSSGAASGANWVLTLTGTPAAGDITAGLSLLVDATNTGACTSASATGLAGGTVIVTGACATPTIGTSLSPTNATVGSAFSATIVVNNCTTATVTNLPGWLSQSYAQSGLNGTISLTGTPAVGDVTAGLALTVDATNNPGGCASSSATGLAGGTLVVANLPACTAPSISATISPATGQVGTAYNGTISVSNATSGVSVTNLPGWASQSVSYTAPNATITITGTPGAGDTGPTNLTVSATNNPAGCSSNTSTGLNGGTLTISALPACTTPTIGATVSPNTVGQFGISVTITVNNATTATVTNLPGGLSASGSASGANYLITITGDWAGALPGTFSPTIDATNAAAGCTSSTATGLSGGTLTVLQAFGGDCCGYFSGQLWVDTYPATAGVPLAFPAGVCGPQTVTPSAIGTAFLLYSPVGFNFCDPGGGNPGYAIVDSTKTFLFEASQLCIGATICP